MKGKIKKKFLWLDGWNIEEQEAWLTDMASKGWKLISTEGSFAKFEQCEPSKVNYRCDVFKLNDTQESSPIELYEEAGWEYVSSRGLVHIFRSHEDANIVEIHTDPVEQAETISVLKKDITKRGMLIVFLSMLIILLTLITLRIDPVGNYLSNKFVEVMVIILAYMYISTNMIGAILHMSRLIKKLKSGNLFEHKIEYKKKMNRNKTIAILFNGIALLWVVSVFVGLIGTITKDRFPPIPEGDIPLVRMSDIMDESSYIRRVSIYKNKGDRGNYYLASSSLLVPKQLELNESVEVPGVMWGDNSGVYSPTIYSYIYETRGEWIAKNLTKELVEKYNYYTEEGYRYENKSGFDELWVEEEENSFAFIGRVGKNVYRIVYYGKEPYEQIAKLVLEKMD